MALPLVVAAGKMDRRVLIMVASKTQAPGSGEVTRDWAPLDTVWAQVDAAGGSESIRSDQPAAIQTLAFTIRYRPDMSPIEDLCLVFEDQVFDVTNVDELGRREGMRVSAFARAEVAV